MAAAVGPCRVKFPEESCAKMSTQASCPVPLTSWINFITTAQSCRWLRSKSIVDGGGPGCSVTGPFVSEKVMVVAECVESNEVAKVKPVSRDDCTTPPRTV